MPRSYEDVLTRGTRALRVAADLLGSRGAALGVIVALAAFSAVVAWAPGGEGALLSDTVGFRAVIAALAVVLTVGLWRRRGALCRLDTAGPWVLHAGLAVTVVVGAAVAGRWTDGEVRAVVGQTVRIPGTPYSIELHRLDPAWRPDGVGMGDAADVTVWRYAREVKRAMVFANHPLRIGNRTIWLSLHGFAPTLVVGEPQRPRAALSVGLETTLSPRPFYWRWFRWPGRGAEVLAYFRPSATGPLPTDPALTLVEPRPAGRSAAVVLRPGRNVVVSGLRVELGEVRYWGAFRVRYEPGLRWLFAGAWVAVAGAAWSLRRRGGGVRAPG